MFELHGYVIRNARKSVISLHTNITIHILRLPEYLMGHLQGGNFATVVFAICVFQVQKRPSSQTRNIEYSLAQPKIKVKLA